LSEDEKAVLAISLLIAAITWGIWFWRGSRLSPLMKRGGARRTLVVAPILCALLLFALLRTWSASDVRNDGLYLFFYQALGAAWVGVATVALPFLGLSARDDVLERKNAGAGWALGGALLGITACFAGGNIGDGPGWWVVLYCAWLSTSALFFLWFVLEQSAHVSEAITLERDAAGALRLAGFLVASGLILGRAVAGDWSSSSETTLDFVRLAWPVLVLLALALLFERVLRPTRASPRPPALTHGLVPLVLDLALAIGWIAWVGPWS
jgi:hypothetical protein